GAGRHRPTADRHARSRPGQHEVFLPRGAVRSTRLRRRRRRADGSRRPRARRRDDRSGGRRERPRRAGDREWSSPGPHAGRHRGAAGASPHGARERPRPGGARPRPGELQGLRRLAWLTVVALVVSACEEPPPRPRTPPPEFAEEVPAPVYLPELAAESDRLDYPVRPAV